MIYQCTQNNIFFVFVLKSKLHKAICGHICIKQQESFFLVRGSYSYPRESRGQLCKPQRKSGICITFKNYPSELVLSGENEGFSVPYFKGISRNLAVARREGDWEFLHEVCYENRKAREPILLLNQPAWQAFNRKGKGIWAHERWRRQDRGKTRFPPSPRAPFTFFARPKSLSSSFLKRLPPRLPVFLNQLQRQMVPCFSLACLFDPRSRCREVWGGAGEGTARSFR